MARVRDKSISNRVYITDNKKGAPLFENRKRVKWKGENKEEKRRNRIKEKIRTLMLNFYRNP